jgi:hypothetical protein
MTNAAARKSIFGVASSRIQASRIVNHLANAGFSRDDISVSIPERDGRDGFGATAMGLGSIPRRLAGAEAFSPPCFKNFTAGGPISGVLCGAAITPASLENMDHHQGSSAEDHFLISLHADDWREATPRGRSSRPWARPTSALAVRRPPGSLRKHFNGSKLKRNSKLLHEAKASNGFGQKYKLL